MLTGSCHCGAVQIQVARKPRRPTGCNCSICRRQAGLWGYYEPAKVKMSARKGSVDRYACNFDPSVVETTRVRRFDGAKTWKFLD